MQKCGCVFESLSGNMGLSKFICRNVGVPLSLYKEMWVSFSENKEI